MEQITMFSLVFVFVFTIFQEVNSNPVVETKYGAVEGVSLQLHSGDVIDSYLAIPFAKPPVDELRFLPPQEPDPWNDTFVADQIGNACMQSVVSTVQISHFGYARFREDCLHVNIYTKQRNDSVLMPVLAWVHGGGYQGGANFIYPGYFLAAKDVVVVTINYRLGIMGYASTGDSEVPGNMGVLDQIQALRFIQENIAAFGGDPDRVTIDGESAGGTSIGMLLMTPMASGLFHGAILQSGNEFSSWAIFTPEHNPSNYFQQVAEQFDCPTEPSSDMVDCLQNVNARSLINARFNCTEGYSCGGFRPVIDGAILPDLPAALRQRKEYNIVPEMIGLNAMDSALFFWAMAPLGRVNQSEFDEILAAYADRFSPRLDDPGREEDMYQAARWFYADWPYVEDPERNFYQLAMFFTDDAFGWSSDWQAKAHSDDEKAFFYIFDYIAENTVFPDFLGCFHGSEIVPEFGIPFLLMEENENVYNHSQFNTYDMGYTDTDKEMSEFLMTLWTNFAKFSNPTPEPVGSGDRKTIMWSQLSRDNLTYAYLGETPEVRMNYRQQEYAFWTEYLNYLAYGHWFENYKQGPSAHDVKSPQPYRPYIDMDSYDSVMLDIYETYLGFE